MRGTVVKDLTIDVRDAAPTARGDAARQGQEESRSSAQQPLRVAHVLPSPGLGGVVTAQCRVARAIEESSDLQSLAFCHGGETTPAAQVFRKASIHTVGYEMGEYSYRRPLPYVRGTMRMARALREHRIDLVHSADLMGAFHAGPASKLARVPLICHIRSNFEDFLTRYKHPLRTVDHFIFVSHAVWENFDKIFPVPASRGSVIYDWGADDASENPEMMATTRARVRESFGIKEGAPVIGMIARVQPPKDFETLLEAMAQVAALKPEARLLIVGEYEHPHCIEHHRHLRRLIEERGIVQNIIWAGLRTDVPDMIRAMDISVLCTHTEGMPLVLLEAMAQGVPVVATRVGGIPELISDGENGLLHEDGNASDLARQLLRLLNDKREATALGERGRVHVREHFSREQTTKALRTLYSRLIGVPL